MDLYKDYLGNAGILQIIRRGTAEMLEENESGIFIRDTLGGSYMLKTDNPKEGIEWLKKHEHRNYELMTLHEDEVVDYAKSQYNVVEEMRCYQGVWTKDKAPERKGILDFRVATNDDAPFLREHYHDWTDEYGYKVIATRELFIAKIPANDGDADGSAEGTAGTDCGVASTAGTEIGFIGRHLEGATGWLFVLPEYRNRGFAEEMEAFMCERTLSQGLISFGHVEVGNEKSMNLQKKIGIEFWDGLLSWLYISD